MDTKNEHRGGYRFMITLVVVVGAIGMAFQFLPGFEILLFMLNLAVLGSLIGGSKGYGERERQQLQRSYKLAFEWLLLVVMVAYALLELSRWIPLEGVTVFLGGHWPGLIIALMCMLMGIAGFYKSGSKDGSA
jgi:hypothetical protein